MKIKIIILILISFCLLLLAGCKTEQQTGEARQTLDASVSYPVSETGLPTNTPYAYPAPGGNTPPPVAQVRENASLMSVEVLGIKPNEKNTTEVILHVKVISSAPAKGLDEYDPTLTGREIDIHLDAADAEALAVGSKLSLMVSYRGDEWGGGFYGKEITISP
jgi:hypothetical protein